MARVEYLEDVWKKYFEVDPEVILYKDQHVIAFPDRNPRAETHVLVVPRNRYIKGTEALVQEDVELLHCMMRVGKQLTGCDIQYMGFHQWPMRSVDHLHLHCLIPPFKSSRQKRRYTPFFEDCTYGYVDISTVLKRLKEM